jgi:hypothetical protein
MREEHMSAFLRRLAARALADGEVAGSVAVAETSSPAGADREVQVIHGASVQSVPLVGLTLREARPLLEAVFGIDANAPLLVNGRREAGGYRLGRADELEVHHPAGEKG